MSFKETTVDTLTELFQRQGSDRAKFAANVASTVDFTSHDQHELVRAMEIALRMSGDAYTAVRFLIDAAMSTALNINGISEEDKERLLFVLAVLFGAPKETVLSFIEKAVPDIAEVYKIYHMNKELNDMLGEYGVEDQPS